MTTTKLLQTIQTKKAIAYLYFTALAFFIFFAVQQVVVAVRDYQALGIQIQIKQADLKRKNQNLLHYESNLVRQQELTGERAALHESVLPRPDVHEQILKMDKLIAAHQLTALDFTVSPLVPVLLESQANVYFSTFRMRLTGSAENAVLFVHSLGLEKPFALVESVTITPEQSACILNVQFQLVYLSNEKERSAE